MQALIDLWNSERKPGPLVRHVTDQRRRQIEARLREHPNLDDWRTVIRFVNRQKWCNAPGTGDHADYRMDFDYLLKPGKLASMLEKASVDRTAAVGPDGLVGRDASRGRTGSKPGQFARALADEPDDDRLALKARRDCWRQGVVWWSTKTNTITNRRAERKCDDGMLQTV